MTALGPPAHAGPSQWSISMQWEAARATLRSRTFNGKEPSMRHKIRTYDTLAFTTHHECMHDQWEHASGPHNMGLGSRQRKNNHMQPTKGRHSQHHR